MYKRPYLEVPKEHPLQIEFGAYKMLSAHLDSGWERKHLEDLMGEGRIFLAQISDTIDRIKSANYSDYKKEAAAKKKSELVANARKTLLEAVKKYIDQAELNVTATKNKVLRVTENEASSDPIKESRQKEIRDWIRQQDPRNRVDLVSGNVEYIKAVVGSPVPIFASDVLEKLRYDAAYQLDPSLQLELNDANLIYKKVRGRAAEINSISVKMLIDQKIDDPVPPEEHFSVFNPLSEHEQSLADKVILNHQREITKAENKKKFDDQQQKSLDLIQDHQQPDLKLAHQARK